METLKTLFTAALGGGLVELIQFLIARHDEKTGKTDKVLKAIKEVDAKVESLERKIDDIEDKVDRNEAVTCRARILRFNKELIKKERHTHEEFSQSLEDCDKYEKYCTKHPDFKNNKAKLSMENIERCYRKCEAEGDFL